MSFKFHGFHSPDIMDSVADASDDDDDDVADDFDDVADEPETTTRFMATMGSVSVYTNIICRINEFSDGRPRECSVPLLSDACGLSFDSGSPAQPAHDLKFHSSRQLASYMIGFLGIGYYKNKNRTDLTRWRCGYRLFGNRLYSRGN